MDLVDTLSNRGVVIHAPASVVIGDDVDPDRIEPGAEIFPGTTIRGARTCIGRGSRVGLAGGGFFENAAIGRNVDIFGGYVSSAVFLDDVVVRGHAEMRRGTLMEEEAGCGHHVGYKMTIMLPAVVAGSLVNFCDALMAGGTSRSDHSEIGSCLALYNFTPWGDKFASLFGDVPHGVFLRSPRIFLGGQTQVVSPVKVGYGALVPAGCAVRRSIPAGRMYGESTLAFDATFDSNRYGGLAPKFDLTCEYVGNLHALAHWYQHVRIPFAAGDPFREQLYRAALSQVEAGIAERIKRLDKLVAKLPPSLAAHQAERARTGAPGAARRIVEHKALMESWTDLKARLEARPTCDEPALAHIRDALIDSAERENGSTAPASFVEAVRKLDDPLVNDGIGALQDVVNAAKR